MLETSTKVKKTLCKKEKLLVTKFVVTTNFSFSYCVFKRLVLQTHKKNNGLYGKGLNVAKTKGFV